MSTLLKEPQPAHAGDRSPAKVTAEMLQDQMPPALKCSRALVGLLAVLGLLYVILSYQRLWHTDVWGHLAYGRWLWNHGRLPATEPLMPLADGMPWTNTAWLSQLLGFAATDHFGPAAMQFFYALSITAAAAALLLTCYFRTGRPFVSVAGLVVFLWVDWQQLIVVRPQLAGLAAFLILLGILQARRWRTGYWYAVPLLFVAWANLHGSFVVGLGLLAATFTGRACDVWRRSRRLGAVLHDRRTRRLLVLTELAAVAALLNPYGLGTYAEVLSFSSNANLQALVEWQPLHLRMLQGQAMALAGLALVVVYRFSPRRVTTAECLLLLGTGAAALWTSRMIVWWAPMAAYYLTLHTSAILSQRVKPAWKYAPSPRTGRWTVVAVGTVWICFAYTPFGARVLHGRSPELSRSVSEQTPLGITDYLRRHPPKGQVFNTYEWGDYFLWAGPPEMEIFAASHAHLIPEDVWQDYLRIAGTAAGWEDRLDRYGVNTVAVDHRVRRELIARLRRDESWRLAYEDAVGAVFVRREPIEISR